MHEHTQTWVPICLYDLYVPMQTYTSMLLPILALLKTFENSFDVARSQRDAVKRATE